ncbi:FTR1 family iron permease [Paenibacillus polymyxa]|uniref:FTR1 family iron permease n=1 Tax=Paenibacillus polymyxa TaxID=1406 RepID=UPI000D988ED5|nr:FTR1 family protein [Paenibacillus polymyxa]MDU8672716.1 FTR1 family protein [Paenibacillus polymyxa]MDU8697623.1 FTR1 family protein [Paenibacillus polymyxa]URJ71290.1 FTR1 family iron permease [Paenibacillus polymyxa]WDZ61534.1 FTR1 family iron permease [Paenibacillus polymyxa]WEC95204.1 FTR1 family iron permease [Paenibacillus polymyxa]
MNRRNKSLGWVFVLVAALLLTVTPFISGYGSAVFAQSNAKAVSNDQLMPVVGGALVEAGQDQWTEASKDLKEFRGLWEAVKANDGDSAHIAAVDQALTDAEEALAHGGGDSAKAALSVLARSVNEFVTAAEGDQPAPAGAKAAEKLLPMAKGSLAAMQKGDWAAARVDYDRIVKAWYQVETPIRLDHFSVYSSLETKISLIRISMQAEPIRQAQALKEMQELTTLLSDYSQGKLVNTDQGADAGNAAAGAANGSTASLGDAVTLLESARQDVVANQPEQAADKVGQFIAVWPSVEGHVQISDPASYTAIENQMTETSGYLLSSPPNMDKALQTLDQMLDRLRPLTEERSYTAWDAALILLREGMEAILVLAALLAYAKKSGEAVAGRWIWAGAGTGLVLSGILAVLFTSLVAAAASGSMRELLEGVTGLVAVVLMLTVGNWLHSKSNAAAWNRFVENSVGNALARGSLWSLFAVSALAILREGAETAIFYIGMAPAIKTSQLLIGIGSATVILVILAFAIIKFSVRLPIRAFFLTATILIYYLVFRFLGESIHSLQVAGKLPGHTASSLPSISWLGMYPTWETFVPQALVLIFMVWQLVRQEIRSSQSR